MNQITLNLRPTAFTTTDNGVKRDKLGLGDIAIPFSSDLKRIIPFSDLEPLPSGKALRTKSIYAFDLVFSESGRAMCTKCTKVAESTEESEVYSLDVGSTPASTNLPE